MEIVCDIQVQYNEYYYYVIEVKTLLLRIYDLPSFKCITRIYSSKNGHLKK